MSLLSVNDLKVDYGSLRAVDGVSFGIDEGETVGLVGESGCGKSTLGRAILRLTEMHSGSIVYEGKDIARASQREMVSLRRELQMIFQDPYGSLNPRKSIHAILSTPLKVHGVRGRANRLAACHSILDKVGLPRGALDRFPHEFSGGQRQRLSIARALILQPRLVVCDEPVSALDLSIQAQVLNLLVRMKEEMKLSYLFVSHDLSVIRYFCDRTLVMYLGKIVESAPTHELWSSPRHPYTMALIDAIPQMSKRKEAEPVKLPGDLPSGRARGSGCALSQRCPLASDICRTQEPELRRGGNNRLVRCHHADV